MYEVSTPDYVNERVAKVRCFSSMSTIAGSVIPLKR